MKSVCIIGAGPSGLVGAKVLRGTGNFDVTIFEKARRIGGIWSQDRNFTEGTFLSPNTPVNISRFSVGFSDHDWNSVDLHPRLQNSELEEIPLPIFPKAWQVNRYLETFRRKNVPDDILKLGHEVIKADRIQRGGESKWLVTTKDKQNRKEQTTEFDLLILATGFFSQPRPLSFNVPQAYPASGVKVIHSSRFRDLGDLFPNSSDAANKTILVIGGSNSAGEAAGVIAQQLSNARFSPFTGTQQLYKGTKIVHVTPKPLYILVPFAPTDESSTTFLPWDLKMYDLSKRPAGPLVGNAGRVPKIVKDFLHGALQGIIGGNQVDLNSPAMEIPEGEPRWPVQVALSESYAEFVRSGSIEVVAGRVTGLNNSVEAAVTATVQAANGETVDIKDIGAVVYATGYSPSLGLDFLSDEVKRALQYDPGSPRLPLILKSWQTATAALPDLSLLGFYEGPYWPMMEMQARLTAARWLDNSLSFDQRPYEEVGKLLDLRTGMQARDRDIPQYWFGDYAGYMEEVASHLKLQRNDAPFAEREGCVAPGRYLSPGTEKAEADRNMQDLYQTWNACIHDGKYVARAVFRALQGDWEIQRTIDSSLSSFPSGTLKGVASFEPRFPTQDASGKSFDFEYLYIESGTLVLSNGAEMPTRRRYVYRYSESRDELSVWFIKPDSDFEVDYLFHNLTFVPPEESRRAKACVAKADHLCVDDMYWTEYRLPIKGISLLDFENKHTVKGPSKDYVTTTTFRRPGRNV